MDKFILIIYFLFSLSANAQKVFDRVDAIVGNEIILTSDIVSLNVLLQLINLSNWFNSSLLDIA